MSEYVVNRKQFHYLVVKFLYEHRIASLWFKETINGRFSRSNRQIYTSRYQFKKDDTFDEYLYKCIDMYMDNCQYRYDWSIYGFFRWIPVTCVSTEKWNNLFAHYSAIWEKKYRNVKYH